MMVVVEKKKGEEEKEREKENPRKGIYIILQTKYTKIKPEWKWLKIINTEIKS